MIPLEKTKNKLLNIFLNLFISALFITIVWTNIYVNIIGYLNFIYPPVLKDHFYRLASAFPEEFEMPLYLLLTFIFTLVIIFLIKTLSKVKNLALISNNGFFLVAKIFTLVVLGWVFLSQLGPFPLANDPYPYSIKTNTSVYYWYLTIYFVFMGIVVAEYFMMQKLTKNTRFLKLALYSLVIIATALLVFEPHFPISPHEYAYFFGPVWDVIKGKTLFANSASDYGFYSVFFFAWAYKFGLFQFYQLPIYIWLFFIVQYFLSFYITYKISRSVVLSFVCLFSIITINYFSLFILPMTITQYSAMRRLPAIFLLFLLYKTKKFDSPLFTIFTVITNFWIIDSGVCNLLALGLTVFLLFINRTIRLKRVLKTAIFLAIGFTVVFLFINLIHIGFGDRPVDYMEILRTLRQHAVLGLTMLPMTATNFFWIVMFIYFLSIIFVFKQEKIDLFDQIILFSTNLSLFHSLYFVGRSHYANLIDISILPVLNFFLIIGKTWSTIISKKVKIFLLLFLFLIFIVFPATQRKYNLTEFMIEKVEGILTGKFFHSEFNDLMYKRFANEKKLIMNNFKENEVLILSRDHTYLLIVSDKKDMLDVNPQSGIDTTSQMKFAIKDVIKKCPKKIAVDCTIYKKCPYFESFTVKSLFTGPLILNEIEKACNYKYYPIDCTNQLCIAKTN